MLKQYSTKKVFCVRFYKKDSKLELGNEMWQGRKDSTIGSMSTLFQIHLLVTSGDEYQPGKVSQSSWLMDLHARLSSP